MIDSNTNNDHNNDNGCCILFNDTNTRITYESCDVDYTNNDTIQQFMVDWVQHIENQLGLPHDIKITMDD